MSMVATHFFWAVIIASIACGESRCNADEYQFVFSCKAKTTCQAGKFVKDPGSPLRDRVCAACPIGQYQPEVNQPRCLIKEQKCSPGRYVINPDSLIEDRMCRDCEEGKWLPSDKVLERECRPKTHVCRPGRFTHAFRSRTSDYGCKACWKGSYQDAANHREPACKACEKGKIVNNIRAVKCWECAIHTYMPHQGGRECLACNTAQGYFQPHKGQDHCESCGSGRHLVTRSAGITCDDCPPGFYQDLVRATTCKACQAGKFTSRAGQTNCSPCQQGKFSSSGAVECLECPEGTIPNSAQSRCESCPAGQYQPQAGKTSCIVCDANLSVTTRHTQCEDIDPPQLFVSSPSNFDLAQILLVEQNNSFAYPTVKARDNYDDFVHVTRNNSIDTAQVGQAAIQYFAIDKAGNMGRLNIAVQIVNPTEPTIELRGRASLTHEAGLTYTDPGAIIVDPFDGNLTSKLGSDATTAVNVSQIGAYTITYFMTSPDSTGLYARNITRTVEVKDTRDPEIVLNGSAILTVEAATTYTEPGYHAFDSFEGDLTSAVIIAPMVDTRQIGVVRVSYQVQDSSGNSATKERSIEIRDTTKPVISLRGDNPLTLEAGSEYIEPGFSSTDTLDGDIEVSVSGSISSRPTELPADFVLTYTAQDEAGNTAQATRTVRVVDTKSPVITLQQRNITLEAGIDYASQLTRDGYLDDSEVYSAYDDYLEDMTLNVTSNLTSLPLQPVSIPHVDVIQLLVADAMGLVDTQHLVVTLIDTTAPEISVTNSNLEGGRDWQDDQPLSVTDLIDGDLTAKAETVEIGLINSGWYQPLCPFFQVTNNASTDHQQRRIQRVVALPTSVNSRAPAGSIYEIMYRVEDTAGNIQTAMRNVTITDSEAPRLNVSTAIHHVEYKTSTSYEHRVQARDNLDGDITAWICYQAFYTSPFAVTSIVKPSQGLVPLIDSDLDISRVHVPALPRTALDNLEQVSELPVATALVFQYAVQDGNGQRVEAEVAAAILDTTAPNLTLHGDREVSVAYDTRFDEPGYSADDLSEGDLSNNVVCLGLENVNLLVSGSYNLTYVTRDRYNNTRRAERVLIVQPFASPPDEYIFQAVVDQPLSTAPSAADFEQSLREAANEPFLYVISRYDSSGPPDRFNALPGTRVSAQSDASSQSMRRLLSSTTVYEFTVRSSGTLAWMTTAEQVGLEARLQARLPEVKSVSTASSSTSNGQTADKTAIVVGVVPACVLVVALVVILAVRRNQQRKSMSRATANRHSHDSQLEKHANPVFGRESSVRNPLGYSNVPLDTVDDLYAEPETENGPGLYSVLDGKDGGRGIVNTLYSLADPSQDLPEYESYISVDPDSCVATSNPKKDSVYFDPVTPTENVYEYDDVWNVPDK